MLAAEKKCTKKHLTTTYKWSLPLMEAGQKITYWKGRKKAIIFGLRTDEFQGYIQYLHQKFGITDKPMTVEDIKDELKDAWKLLKKIQREDRTYRDAFLEELADLRAKEQSISAASAIKQIRNIEKTIDMHKHINYAVEKESRGAVDAVLVHTGSDPEGEFGKSWTRIGDKHELEQTLLHRNEAKFRESRDSVFATSSIGEDIGILGDGDAVEQILNGTYTLREDILQRHNSEIIRIFIQELAQHNKEVESIDPLITTQDMKELFGNTREKTSSSPSGLHVGHYKAGYENAEIAEILTSFTALPFLYGFTLSRWKKSLHVMLPKLNRPYIHKLRIVQLFEADFNAGLKILYSRRLMSNTEKFQLNTEQIYGGRRGKTVHDCLTNLQLTYEYSQVTCSPMALIFDDMAGCYDRIRLNLNTITTRRMGMTKNAAITHSKTITGMTHKVRTAYGDSEGRIAPDKEFGGSGQGSGGSPPACHTQIVPMVKTLQKISPGNLISDPTGTLKVLQHVINWVDDTAHKEDLIRERDFHHHLKQIGDILIKWRSIIRTTGGDLELSKTVVYLINYCFSDGGTNKHFQRIYHSPGTVELPGENANEKPAKIRRKEFFQAEKQLGIRLAPDGNMDQEFEFRRRQAAALGYKFSKSYITRPEATLAYQSRWLSLIGFYLPITTFSRSRCEQIQKPIYSGILPKMGYNRHLPLAVRFGPIKYGGAGMVHVFTEQIIKHIQLFTGISRQETELAKIQRIVLSSLQLYVGSQKLFLNTIKKKYSYVTMKGRMNFLWEISNESDITYQVEQVFNPTPQRRGDKTIMDILVKSGVSKQCLVIINACRIFLRVIYLSDIVSADGKMVLKWATHPKRNMKHRSALKWPFQPFPSEDNWKTWRLTLLKHLGVTTNVRNEWILHNPLGPWITEDTHLSYRYKIHLPSGNLWDIKNSKCYSIKHFENVFHISNDEGTVPSSHLSPADIFHSSNQIKAIWDHRPAIITPIAGCDCLTILKCLCQKCTFICREIDML